MANYREPQWLLPNEKNLAMPASDATVGSGLAEDRQSLYSMDFDGSNDYIDCGDNDLLSFGNGSSDSPFTVSSWIYAKGSSTFPFFDKYPDAGTWALREYRMEVFGTDKVVLIIYDGSASARHEIYSDSVITRDQWQHVVITYDGRGGATAGDGVKIYINGSESTTTIFSYGTYVAMENTTSPVRIGRIGSTYADGKIDETAVWNKALSASEVSALTTANAPANILALSDKPVAYYPLGEQARLGSEWQFPNEVLQSQVFDFDGSTDFIEIPKSNALGLVDTNFSISIWLNPDVSHNGLVMMNYSGFNGWGVYYASGSIRFYDGSVWTTLTTISTSQWSHILIVGDNTGNNLICYKNGVEVYNSSYTVTITESSGNVFIGSEGGTGFFFNGKLSNIALWESNQSANIANIYNNGSPQSSYTTTPTAWYKLNATSNYAGLNPNFHNALDFVAVDNDYIDLGTDSSLDIFGGDFSASLWFKHSNASGNALAMMEIAGFSDKMAMTLGFTSNTGVGFAVGSNWYTNAGTGFNDGEWHHMVATRTGTTYKIYIDSQEITASVPSGGWNYNTTASPYNRIGTGFTGATKDFNGELSNIAIYNQVISAEDVLYLYNGGTPQTSLSFEPVSWYKLNNLTTGIQDSGSASNNGTNNGATAVSSSVAVDQWNFDNVSQAQTPNWSSALDFISSPQQTVNLGTDIATFKTTSAFSFSLWVNFSSAAVGNYRGLFSTTTSGNGYLLWKTNGNQLAFLVRDGVWKTASSSKILGADEWHHVVCTFDGSSTSKIYVDSVVGGTTSNPTTVDYAAGTQTRIGNYGAYNMDGQMSNFKFWSSELSQADVNTLYNNGQPQSTASLSPTSWYKLDNTASGIQDSGSASNNGTNNGATEIQTNVWTPRLNGESTTLPSTALVSSDLQFESPYSNFSLEFDGTDQYIATANTFLNSASVCTISFWCKLDSATSSIAIGDYISSFNGIAINYAGTYNLIRFRTMNGGNVFTDATLTGDTNWHNIVCVYEGGVSAKIYADGILLSTNTTSIPATLPATTGDDFRIGTDSNTVYSTGKIDETAIWSSALTQAQISQVYNNGYPADLTSLSPVSWWRLGEDAYFVSPNFTVPNQITGAPNGTSANMDQADLVADAPGSYASGVGSSLALADRVGDAPESTANSLSFNMTPLNKISYPAGYAPTQADNVYSMAFDGISDYIEISSGTLFDFGSNPFSFSGWFTRGNTAVGNDVLFFSRKSTTTPSWQIRQNVNNIQIEFNVGGVWSDVVTTTNPIAMDTNWHHLAITKSGTSASIYIDGVAQATSGTAPSTIDAGDGTAFIGSRNGSGIQEWFGNIDEVAIFDYALSARQIKQDIYNGTTTGKTADLNNISNLTAPVAWYRMGD